MSTHQNDRKQGDARRSSTDPKPGAGGQTGGHIGKTDRKETPSSEPLAVNQGGYSSNEGEGVRNTEGTVGQDVNNRTDGINPYTDSNDPKNAWQRMAEKTGSEYGSEGNENRSGTGNKDRAQRDNQKRKR
jgi:hypothetical protein